MRFSMKLAGGKSPRFSSPHVCVRNIVWPAARGSLGERRLAARGAPVLDWEDDDEDEHAAPSGTHAAMVRTKA
jgi:hypothetical protein